MRIALAQMQMAEDSARNLDTSLEMIRDAKRAGADLILFPEVQLSPFFAQYPGQERESFAMTMEDPAVQKILASCRREKIWAAPNFYLREDGKYFDTSLLVDDRGEVIGRQTMVHVAQAPCFYEQDYYTPSGDGFHVFETPFGKIGIVICFDRHYPESIRTEALMGADIILIPTANTTAEPEEMFQWEIRVQAFQNSTFAAILPVGKNRSIGCRLFEHLMVTAAAAIIDDHNLKSRLTKLTGRIAQFQIWFKCRN